MSDIHNHPCSYAIHVPLTRADTFIMPIGWGLGTYTLAFPSGLTLHQYFAQGAGIASSAGCEAHVLARVSTSQVVQDKRTRAIGVFNEDVVRVHLHWLPIWKGGEGHHRENTIRDKRSDLSGGSQSRGLTEEATPIAKSQWTPCQGSNWPS